MRALAIEARTSLHAGLAATLLWSGAGAQPADPAAPTPDAPPAAEPPPAEEPPPDVLEPPPLPPPDADFSADRALFGEVKTAPEDQLAAERAAETAPARGNEPLYTQMPGLAWLTQAVGGVFGAGAVGLLFGSIGEAIDPGDERLPLGGFHGPAIGGLAGSFVGSALGVWGAGLLFDKDVPVWWAVAGAGIGTAVGGGAAIGIAAGLDEGDGSAALAVGTLLAAQVALAIIFGDYALPDAPRPSAPPAVAPVGQPGEIRLVVPLLQTSF
jgi:hypothetical protein